ncbi:8044_t:CDS:2 [Ambispora gerdemannii]|uniref:UDP-N-acetylglucosamine transferase subunit ALG13 n=1 Tax=Ambispora gerdemannii TaxID=144530 RepID=A0A9N8V8J4_9GLOM|nr:8044_t:CDS:2 [Ambispora gerdemannii]
MSLEAARKTVFITVGSTGFDDLVRITTSVSFLELVSSLGYTRVLVQYGKSHSIFNGSVAKDIKASNGQYAKLSKIKVDGYDYKSSLRDDMENAELIISHAGSGSILESLRLHKKLIVVVNDALMNNHQNELAVELSSHRYLLYSSVSDLLETLKSRRYEELVPFPAHNENLFVNILDEEM